MPTTWNWRQFKNGHAKIKNKQICDVWKTDWTSWWRHLYIQHVASKWYVAISLRSSFWRFLMFAAEACMFIHFQCWNTCFVVWMNVLFPSVVPQLPIQNPFLSNKWVKKKSKPSYICWSLFLLFPSISFHFLFHIPSISFYFHPFLMSIQFDPFCSSNILITFTYRHLYSPHFLICSKMGVPPKHPVLLGFSMK